MAVFKAITERVAAFLGYVFLKPLQKHIIIASVLKGKDVIAIFPIGLVFGMINSRQAMHMRMISLQIVQKPLLRSSAGGIRQVKSFNSWYKHCIGHWIIESTSERSSMITEI